MLPHPPSFSSYNAPFLLAFVCSFRGGQCSRGTSAPLFHSSNHQSASFRILSLFPMHHIYQGEREGARAGARFLLLRFSIKTPVAIGIKRPIHESALFRSRRYPRFVNGYGPRARWLRAPDRVSRVPEHGGCGDYLPPLLQGGNKCRRRGIIPATNQ